eukprot:scaffold267193_cov32-Tisochrysis_lutea.AAC.2
MNDTDWPYRNGVGKVRCFLRRLLSMPHLVCVDHYGHDALRLKQTRAASAHLEAERCRKGVQSGWKLIHPTVSHSVRNYCGGRGGGIPGGGMRGGGMPGRIPGGMPMPGGGIPMPGRIPMGGMPPGGMPIGGRMPIIPGGMPGGGMPGGGMPGRMPGGGMPGGGIPGSGIPGRMPGGGMPGGGMPGGGMPAGGPACAPPGGGGAGLPGYIWGAALTAC